MKTSTEFLKRCDVVEVSAIMTAIPCGSRFIIVEVHRNRPANPYVAIKERGNGAKYKLGHKHHPRKVGTVPETHYLLNQTAFRDFDRLGPGAKQMLRDALNGDTTVAQTILGMLD